MSDESQWIKDDSIAFGSGPLSIIRGAIENESAVIVEHRFYRGARSPHRFVCDDFADLEKYLKDSTYPGDSIYCWKFEACCTNENSIVAGKMPDSLGRTPRGGAY